MNSAEALQREAGAERTRLAAGARAEDRAPEGLDSGLDRPRGKLLWRARKSLQRRSDAVRSPLNRIANDEPRHFRSPDPTTKPLDFRALVGNSVMVAQQTLDQLV